MPGPQPQLVALLLCDRAFQEAVTGNWCVIGAFDTINAPQLPTIHPGFLAFVAMSDFSGGCMVQLVIRDQEGEVVKAVRGQVPRTELGLFQGAFPFPEVEFKTAGVHTLELFSGDDLVTLRSFRVVHATAAPEAERQAALEAAARSKEQLLRDAQQVWSEHPNARPFGLVVAVEAARAPWFRAAFQQAFGSPPPELPTVGLIDEPAVRKLLGGHVPEEAREWLAEPAADERHRVLSVLVATGSGYHFLQHRAGAA